MNERNDFQNKIRIGISSCLLGEKVRFDGNHKRQLLITDELSNIFEYIPTCPEVAIGMGVPRRPIRLVGDPSKPKAQDKNNTFDITDQLVAFSEKKSKTLQDISGYIFKKGSPSCGMERVKVYRDHNLVSTQGMGLFAKAVIEANPLMPVEEEGRLQNPLLKENFIQRVKVFHRWQQLLATGLSKNKLIVFHTQHKYLLLAHDESIYRSLGRLIANIGNGNLDSLSIDYISQLMCGLKKTSTRSRHVNVLQHLMGFLKSHIDADDKDELLSVIAQYRRGSISLDTPKTLLRHHFRRVSMSFVQQQYYLYQ